MPGGSWLGGRLHGWLGGGDCFQGAACFPVRRGVPPDLGIRQGPGVEADPVQHALPVAFPGGLVPEQELVRFPVAEITAYLVLRDDLFPLYITGCPARLVGHGHVHCPVQGQRCQCQLVLRCIEAGLRCAQTQDEFIAVLSKGEVAVAGIEREGHDSGRA